MARLSALTKARRWAVSRATPRDRGNYADVLVLGPVPPPYGGVAVHISRSYDYLTRHNLHVLVANRYGAGSAPATGALHKNPFAYFWAPSRYPARVVHYHYSEVLSLLAVALRARISKRPYVVTIHSHALPDVLAHARPPVRALLSKALASFTEVIAVSDAIAGRIRQPGCAPVVVPAFLPPICSEMDHSRLSPSLRRALQGGNRTAVLPVFRFLSSPVGDIYGVDLAIEAVARLREDGIDLRLLVLAAEAPASADATACYEALRRRIRELGVVDRVEFFFGEPVVPALTFPVVLLRPTRTDGDAVSVREALCLGVPVIASDVAMRPAGVLTFSTGDAAALARALVSLMAARLSGSTSHQPSNVHARSRADEGESGQDLLGVYQRCLRLCASPQGNE
jgi:glycosyltransferase involved in cell wall biosynthesis